MLTRKCRSFRSSSTKGGRVVVIAFTALLLSGFGLIPIMQGEAAAQNLDYTQPFVHDIQMPSPDNMGPDVYLEAPGVLSSPPDNPEVGDSWYWWLWVHDPMPPHYVYESCTVRGKSDRGYVVVRDSEWNVSINQAEVDIIMERWENTSPGPYPNQGVYEIDSIAFGTPPDEMDEDPRIYLMWFDFVISADGFFFWFDQYPEGQNPPNHSNECEVLYLSTGSSGGGPGSDYMLAVAAHEFQHMIHWKYDDDEVTWVNESLSELAMWLYGNPDNISMFNSNPDNNLTEWDATWADYIQTYLWALYFYEQYGGHETTYALVHEPLNSIAGYEAVLDDFGYSENFADIFADWAVANFLDDTTIEDGRFGYEGDDLPPFNVSGTYSTYPVSDIYKTVNHWAADYYRFQDFDGFQTLLLSFDGNDSNAYAVWALAQYGNGTTEVLRMTLEESSQTGEINVMDLTDPNDVVILVVASTSSTGGTGYYFSADANVGIEDDVVIIPPVLQLQAIPNPFSTSVILQLNFAGISMIENPEIEIYDMHGRMINRLSATLTSENEATLIWNGHLEDGSPANPGLYYARIDAGSTRGVVKLLYLP
ncbi:MAG: T9SS type A sorting domain-containing protein [Candidatus Aegiribacteria sp.]|nr:T9SS type A sorting domain-containing protein [Candidatus Aegiribacteria sp.]